MPVSKLHVLALREIVADIGADRGILLSESGFQSDAVEAANLTNVQLTSITRMRNNVPSTQCSAKATSMQCKFCHKEVTEGGYIWLNKQWCVISHVEPRAVAGLPHICNNCSISLSKKEIIQELMKQHPAHKRAVESIIERCNREGYGITFPNQEVEDLLGLEQSDHYSREEREDYKIARKQGLDNIKRDLLYNYNLRFIGTKKTKKGHGGWCVRQY